MATAEPTAVVPDLIGSPAPPAGYRGPTDARGHNNDRSKPAGGARRRVVAQESAHVPVGQTLRVSLSPPVCRDQHIDDPGRCGQVAADAACRLAVRVIRGW